MARSSENAVNLATLPPSFETVGRADLSFDGSRDLFVGRRSASDPFSVWERGMDGTGLHEVVRGPGDCRQAFYLSTLYTLDADAPVHQVAFVCTPGEGGAPAIFTSGLDGSRVRQITFAPGGVADPRVLADGRLLFRMPAVPSDDQPPAWFTVSTDGTELFAFEGSESPAEPAIPSAMAQRCEPAGHSSVVRDSWTTGQVYCLNANLTDTPSAPEGAVRRVRVSSRMPEAKIMQQEAQVEADGSFYLELPARTAIRFETLDENGEVLRAMKTWMWVMPGEQRGCIGCHEDRERTPPNRHVLALRKAPQGVGFPAEDTLPPTEIGGGQR